MYGGWLSENGEGGRLSRYYDDAGVDVTEAIRDSHVGGPYRSHRWERRIVNDSWKIYHWAVLETVRETALGLERRVAAQAESATAAGAVADCLAAPLA